MSPRFYEREQVSPGFPRVSGDEPLTGMTTLAESAFSPRERG